MLMKVADQTKKQAEPVKCDVVALILRYRQCMGRHRLGHLSMDTLTAIMVTMGKIGFDTL